MACKDHIIVSQQKWLTVPFVNGIGEARRILQRIITGKHNISYSALSSPMNILSTVGGFWVNELDSLVV